MTPTSDRPLHAVPDRHNRPPTSPGGRDMLRVVLGPAENLIAAVRANNGPRITDALTDAAALILERHFTEQDARAGQISDHDTTLCGYWGAAAVAILLAAAVEADSVPAMTLWTEHRGDYTRLRQAGHTHRCAALYAPVAADLLDPGDTSCCTGSATDTTTEETWEEVTRHVRPPGR